MRECDSGADTVRPEPPPATPVSALDAAFSAARRDGRALLVGYLPAGFPTVQGGIDAIRAMVEAGVDAVEIGLPYSDPVMDGPTIQRAADIALRGGVRTRDVLATVTAVAELGVPTLVMTYWNPVERYGVDAFARDLFSAGGTGLITPDLTPDEGRPWIEASDAYGLDRVFLVSPSSTDVRVAAAAAACRGFVYATAVMGVTGAREAASSLAPRLVARVRDHSALPVGVGVGVSTGAQATEVAGYADAVIVGSALVATLLTADSTTAGTTALQHLVAELAAGVASAARPVSAREDNGSGVGSAPAMAAAGQPVPAGVVGNSTPGAGG